MSTHSDNRSRSWLGAEGLRNLLIRLYPPLWRERYENEFEILLEECLHSPLDIVDILLGALDAQVEFPFDMSWRSMNMVNKLRTSILIVFVACVGFVIGGMGLFGLADDSPMAALMRTNLPLSAAWIAVQVGAVVALLAAVVGGTPLASTIIRRALTSPRKQLRYVLVPVLSALALVLYAAFAASIGLGHLHVPGVLPVVSHDNLPLGNGRLIGGFILLFVFGAVASTMAVWKVVSDVDNETSTLNLLGKTAIIKPYDFAFIPSLITALGMLWMLLATMVWGLLAYSAMPDVFAANWGLLMSNTTLSFAIILAIMLLSTLLACFGVARGYSARKLA
jgi:hypothetical protein